MIGNLDKDEQARLYKIQKLNYIGVCDKIAIFSCRPLDVNAWRVLNAIGTWNGTGPIIR